MAEFVNPILNIISCLWKCCATHTRYLCILQENQISLRTAMNELKNMRNDVQRDVVEAEADPNEPKMRTDKVGAWLQSIETIDREVDVILQKAGELLNNTRCLGGFCPPNNCWSNYKVGKSIAKKILLVDELKGKGSFDDPTYRLPIPHVQDINRESPVGMEFMFNEVWRLINNKDDKQPVNNIIGLHGPGGVGKTTLLEEINNEFKNKINSGEYGFVYVVIFVVVSKPINYEAIQKKIGERLGLSDSLQGDGNESSRAEKIFNALRNKNYVLLLDDIWEDQFDKKRIGIPIHIQGNSKLIFTTRSERVCEDMGATHTFQVKCLLWDEAWSLFQEKVGEKALNYLSGANELAKDVARECSGLPLALITIGRAMSTKKSVREWRDALTQLRYASDFKDMRDTVLPRLKLSYDNLSNETEKSCFRYCALYPKDYSIEINTLIDYWIAEGFLDEFEKLDEARNRGQTIIESLKSACLLESSGGNHVKMHDVIRDLALWIVNGCRSTGESGRNSGNNKYLVALNDPCKKWKNAERIFWDADNSTSSSYTTTTRSNSSNNEEENQKLLTLIMVRKMKTRYHYLRLSPSFFHGMPGLRVLDLSNTQCFGDEFPISICELRELQYLNLSGTGITELPDKLRKLVKLKFLVLSKLRRIPAGVIAYLSQLQVLNLNGFEDWELIDGPSFSELDDLTQLQEVQITITTSVALEKFLCNQKLQMVCTGLNFLNYSSSSSSSSSSRRVLDLSNFKSLKDLIIERFSELEELELYGRMPSNLALLRLDCLPKLNNILWMAAAAQPDLLCSPFESLHRIWIVACNALKDLTWLVYVKNLKELYVSFCEGIETIIDLRDDDDDDGGLRGGGGRVFRGLKTLDLKELPKLKSICKHALDFPSIKVIRISKCPKLNKLPLGSGSNVHNTLERIYGNARWWNELQWEDETIKSKFLPYLDNKEIDHDHNVEADSPI